MWVNYIFTYYLGDKIVNINLMALSFSNVEKAYKVFNKIKKTVLPELTINSWPEDMREWSESDRENPRMNVVYGFDKKADDGWENIYFFVENPTQELKDKFEELKGTVGNSSMAHPYGNDNSPIWIFGWF